LEDFLEDGDKPIYFGWGSMEGFDIDYITDAVLHVIHHGNHRAVLLRHSFNLTGRDLGPNIYVGDQFNHNVLFPKMKVQSYYFYDLPYRQLLHMVVQGQLLLF
jgi:sterol 3beta-glucosyltransferase